MILIYEIDKNQVKSDDAVDMDKLIGAITKRINPGGVKEINIRKYGKDGIEIVIPDVNEGSGKSHRRFGIQSGNFGISHFGEYQG